MSHLLFALVGSSCLALLARLLSRHTSSRALRRLSRPLRHLGRYALVKGVVAVLALQIDALDAFLDLLASVFEIRNEAAFALAFVICLDVVTGVYASWWRKTEELGRVAMPKEFLSSRRLRDSILKVGEYVAVILLFTVGANVWAVEVGWAKRWTLLMVFLTEAWSLRENFQHVPVRSLFSRLGELYEQKSPGNVNSLTSEDNQSQ